MIWWGVALVACLAMAFLVYASWSIRFGFYLRSTCSFPTSGKEVALTFDDGPAGESTEKTLQILAEHNLKATFFCIGERVRAHSEQLAQIARQGHAIGMHSWGHRWHFPFLTIKKMERDLRRCREEIEERVGYSPTLFRPPFGVTNPTIAKVVKRQGLSSIGWSIRSLDTQLRNPERVAKRVSGRLHPGAIILLHDHLPETPKTVTLILREINRKGYRVVPLP